MKTFWLEKNECSACGACVNVCPKNAIRFETDACGFSYPVISSNCVDCSLCEKVCNERKKTNNGNSLEPLTYAAWSKDQDIRYNSTSGGVFSEIAKEVFRRGGCVVGAQYRDDNSVEHTIVYDEAGLERIRQSKYTQSDIGLVFRDIKTKLDCNKLVAFCGAPCQVAALKSYLRKQYENLITIDFICRGMNSPKAYRAWLDEIEAANGSKVKKVWFKYKDGGWKTSPTRTRIDFENGNYLVLEKDNNMFMSGYLGSNLYIRPSCGMCAFKSVPRYSDITLADFWGLRADIDDDKGASLVLINNRRGESLFNSILTHLTYYQRSFEEIFAGNGCFNDSVEINPRSREFLVELDSTKFSKAWKKYTKRSARQRLLGVFRRIKHIMIPRK